MQAEIVVIVVGCVSVVVILFGIIGWGMYQDAKRSEEKLKD
jgi:hypothetical protein